LGKNNSQILEKNRGYFLYVFNYAIVLFLIGIAMLAWFHSFGLEKNLKENTALAVELKSNISEQSIQKFKNWLESQTEIIPASVHRVDSSDFANLLSTEWELDQVHENFSSLIPQILIFKMKQDFLNDDKIKSFSEKLYKQEGVQHFIYQNELTQNLSSVIDRIKLGFLILTSIFILAGILISEYLARVLDSREAVIRNWNELGATQDKFIKPYLKRVVYLGLASACLSVCLIGLIIGLSFYLIPWVSPWIETKKFLLIMIILLILGPTLQYILVKRKIIALLN
jgi:cell division protein FtsX